MDRKATFTDHLSSLPGRARSARTHNRSGRVIQLKERSLVMLTNDLILRNPLRLLGHENDDIIPPGGFGAVLARAGIGKTALVVQIALNSLLREKNVLHISLKEPIGKVNLRYQEVLDGMAQQYQLAHIEQLWDTVVHHRFIMTFQVEGFSVPKLEERLTDLTTQHIFNPQVIILDGVPFDDPVRPLLVDLKGLANRFAAPVWFTITTHRHEAPAADGLPIQFSPVQDLFDTAITLSPAEQVIHIKAIKGCPTADPQGHLVLDPVTMLIQDKG
jgi:hypothetical protein